MVRIDSKLAMCISVGIGDAASLCFKKAPEKRRADVGPWGL